ncbi:MAG: hypothetical protein IE927_12180, partial [Rhodobacterales bacterium]|nr:hypothetical protein [Rhodobacterales bacterium]
MPARALALALLLTGPAPAAAGAWLQEEGATFLSFGSIAGDGAPVWSALVEHGVRARLTLGLAGWAQGGDGALRVFARLLLHAGAQGTRAAAELGLAADDGARLRL